jgi:hypothetical protein
VVAGPAIAAGAIEEEKNRGTLELLVASPLTERQIILSMVGGRLVVAAQFLVTALPVFAIAAWLGGIGPLGFIRKAVLPIGLGAALSTAYAIRLAVQGVPFAAVWRNLAMFVIFTPFAPGGLEMVPWSGRIASWMSLWIIVLLVLLCVFPLALAFFFPFWGLAAGIFLDPAEYPLITGMVTGLAALSATLGVFCFLRQAPKGLRSWVRRSELSASRERRSYQDAGDADGGRSRSFAALRRVLRREAAPPGETESLLPTLSRQSLRRLDGLRRWVYRAFRRNPLVARELLSMRREQGVLIILLAMLLACMIFTTWITSIASSPGERELRGVARFNTVLTGMVLLITAAFACMEGSRLLPPRSQPGLLAVLLSAPLRGRQIVEGGLGILLLRLWPAAAAIAIMDLFLFGLDLRPLWSAGRLALFAALVLLAYGISLWVSLALRGPGERVGASFAAFLFAAIGSGLLAPGSERAASLLPLRAWFDLGENAFVWSAGSAALTGAAALCLIITFALLFDRAAGRPG